MAISTRTKNRVIADWKTGTFTRAKLTKKYKFDPKTIRKLVLNVDNINQRNGRNIMIPPIYKKTFNIIDPIFSIFIIHHLSLKP